MFRPLALKLRFSLVEILSNTGIAVWEPLKVATVVAIGGICGFLCFTIVAQRQHVAYGGVNGIFTPNCKPSVRKKHIFSLHIGFGAIKYQ